MGYVSPRGKNFRKDLWGASLPELEVCYRLCFLLCFLLFLGLREEQEEVLLEVLGGRDSEEVSRRDEISRDFEPQPNWRVWRMGVTEGFVSPMVLAIWLQIGYSCLRFGETSAGI